MLKKLAAGGAAVAIGASVWGIAGEDHTTRDETGNIVQAGQLGAFVTRVGDCFESLPVENGGVSTIPAVPCSQAHHWQVFYKGDISLTEYSDSGVEQASNIICENALRDIGENLPDAKLAEYANADFNILSPSSQSWEKEDRSVDCLIGSDIETYFTSFN